MGLNDLTIASRPKSLHPCPTHRTPTSGDTWMSAAVSSAVKACTRLEWTRRDRHHPLRLA